MSADTTEPTGGEELELAKDETDNEKGEEKGAEHEVKQLKEVLDLRQTSFTSEIYKIEIRNIPPYTGFQVIIMLIK